MAVDNPLERLLARLPPEVMETMTEEERIAIWQAANPVTWRRHPINIRLTVPWVGARYFLTVVGGSERRSPERVRRERAVHPIKTAGNFLFLLGVGGSFYLVAVAALVMFSHLVEF